MSIVEKLSLKHAIIQAPMAGVTTAEMVKASIDVGILGSIGAGYLSVEEMSVLIREIKAYSKKPFMINLFAHEVPPIVQNEITIARQALIDANIDEDIRRDELHLSRPIFDEQLAVVLEEEVPVCSFTFGLPTKRQVNQLKEKGTIVGATATSLDEIREIIELDLDFICLQGNEAGGHRASFIEPIQYIPLSDLLNQARQLTDKPLFVGGGISTKQQMDNYIDAGATAVILGTLLVVSDESAASSAHKERILASTKNETVITKVFSGRPARGIRNDFIDKMTMLPIAPFPYQNDLTKGVRARAAANHNAENIALWAGKSLYLCKPGSLREIIERFLA